MLGVVHRVKTVPLVYMLIDDGGGGNDILDGHTEYPFEFITMNGERLIGARAKKLNGLGRVNDDDETLAPHWLMDHN